jgi:tetratricopeptide (TPR) repeat protein
VTVASKVTVTSEGDRHLSLILGALLLALVGCTAGPSPTAVSPSPTLPPPTATPGPAALYDQGLACQRVGDWECARTAFSRALELDPSLAPAYRARGAVHLALGDGPAALRDAQMAIALAPEDAGGYALLGEVLRRAFNDPVQALDAYGAAVKRDPIAGAGSLPGPLGVRGGGGPLRPDGRTGDGVRPSPSRRPDAGVLPGAGRCWPRDCPGWPSAWWGRA